MVVAPRFVFKKKVQQMQPPLTWLSKPDGFPKKLADEAIFLDSLLLKNDGLEDCKVGLLLVINGVKWGPYKWPYSNLFITGRGHLVLSFYINWSLCFSTRFRQRLGEPDFAFSQESSAFAAAVRFLGSFVRQTLRMKMMKVEQRKE